MCLSKKRQTEMDQVLFRPCAHYSLTLALSPIVTVCDEGARDMEQPMGPRDRLSFSSL